MKNKKQENEEKKILLEELLRNLREKNEWQYVNVVVKLAELGVMVNEKTIRKWEAGLEYPELDVIYKLSEIYNVPSKDFIDAKNNSYQQGLNAVCQRAINIFCYITGLSLKAGYIFFYFVLFVMLIYALTFFTSSLNQVARNWVR